MFAFPKFCSQNSTKWLFNWPTIYFSDDLAVGAARRSVFITHDNIEPKKFDI